MNNISRRSFIKSTSLGMTIFATQAFSQPLSTLIFDNKKQNIIDLDYVIYDKGVKRSEEFAKKMAALGTKTYEINGDISNLWSEVIRPTWGIKNDTAIAGLTTYETLFVLQKVAFDRGMVLYFNAEHKIDGKDAIHNIKTTKNQFAKIKNNLGKYSWTETLALNMNSYPYEKAQIRSDLKSVADSSANKEILYSWIIAPRVS
ncbi:hypothetical protein [Halarcobacter ebronensis]|uniref:Uncharacterized protein n=1 Tax=Halarcobacter ebronensis TaxID=1462615 RepID=A0A4V1M0K4_9BACT|nr:hypothetical protein [Halarcobacter ebronensis]QKF81043.1 hypothetical protein AEBR_0535 [Halarcobacter ebronensis]RXK06353.1 hypothetical protein CRV07_06565 [Halarcobacter ebronensis]